MKNPDTGALILAAGDSSRMKFPKPLLKFTENLTFIEKIVSVYSDWGCPKICVVTNAGLAGHDVFMSFSPPVEIVINPHPELERFYSAKTGVKRMAGLEYCFLQNADNPFTGMEILNEIFKHRNTERHVKPVFKGKGGHPVLLNRKIMQIIESFPDDKANLKDVLKNFPALEVNINSSKILLNINTPGEYSRCKSFYKLNSKKKHN